MRNDKELLCLTFALSAMLACGPQVGQTSGGEGDAGEETPKGDVGDPSSTSTGGASESTGIEVGCGNGVIEDGEWCYERVVFDQSALPDQRSPDSDHLRRVVRGWGATGEGFTIFGEQIWEARDEPSGVSFRRYFMRTGVGSETELIPAKLARDGEGRVDYFFHRTLNVGVACSLRAPFAPAPSRIPPDDVDSYQFSAPTLGEFECARDGLVVPINLDNEGTDWFFGADNDTKLGGLYPYDHQSSRGPWSGGINIVGIAQEIGEITACTMVHLRAGDVDGDGFEDALLYGRDCPDGSSEQLISLHGDGQGLLDPTPRSSPFLAGGEVLTMWLEDLDLDGAADVVLAGDGFVQVVYGGTEGFEPPEILDVVPRSFPLDEETTVLPVAFGEFDANPGLEILVLTEDSIAVVSPTDGVLHRFEEDPLPTSYAAADLNHDGLADVASLHGRSLVFHLSTP